LDLRGSLPEVGEIHDSAADHAMQRLLLDALTQLGTLKKTSEKTAMRNRKNPPFLLSNPAGGCEIFVKTLCDIIQIYLKKIPSLGGFGCHFAWKVPAVPGAPKIRRR